MKKNRTTTHANEALTREEKAAYYKVAFEDEHSSGNRITALLVSPGMYPQEIQIGNNITDFQELIGEEDLEFTPHPFDDYAVFITPSVECAEELEPNRALRCPNGDVILVFFGSFLIVGGNREDGFRSLTFKQKRRYELEYRQPEAFQQWGDHILIGDLPDDLDLMS